MTSPTGPDQNYPQGGAPQGQPGWSATPQPGHTPPPGSVPQGHDGPGYEPTPSYAGGPAPAGQRPGMVTAAGVIAIVWGALGLLFGLLALGLAFSIGALLGLLALLSIVVAGALLWSGIQVLQGKSPRLLLLLSYVAIAINLITMIIGVTQGLSILSYLLGFVVPGVVVFLLLNPQSKQHYAARGISY